MHHHRTECSRIRPYGPGIYPSTGGRELSRGLSVVPNGKRRRGRPFAHLSGSVVVPRASIRYGNSPSAITNELSTDENVRACWEFVY